MTVSLVTRGGREFAISTSRCRSPSAPLPLSYVEFCCGAFAVPVVLAVVESGSLMIFALTFVDERYGSPLLVIRSCVDAL